MGKIETKRQRLKDMGFVCLRLYVHPNDIEYMRWKTNDLQEKRIKEIEDGKFE